VSVFCHLVNDWTSWLQPFEISVKQGSREGIARFAHNSDDEVAPRPYNRRILSNTARLTVLHNPKILRIETRCLP
jgi:hypothetical protein